MSTHADVLRTEQINLKLSVEELARLKRLADHHAVTLQIMLRMLLKRASDEFDAAQGAAKLRKR
jgi:predicted DNA binding CopG/RHH family protein